MSKGFGVVFLPTTNPKRICEAVHPSTPASTESQLPCCWFGLAVPRFQGSNPQTNPFSAKLTGYRMFFLHGTKQRKTPEAKQPGCTKKSDSEPDSQRGEPNPFWGSPPKKDAHILHIETRTEKKRPPCKEASKKRSQLISPLEVSFNTSRGRSQNRETQSRRRSTSAFPFNQTEKGTEPQTRLATRNTHLRLACFSGGQVLELWMLPKTADLFCQLAVPLPSSAWIISQLRTLPVTTLRIQAPRTTRIGQPIWVA